MAAGRGDWAGEGLVADWAGQQGQQAGQLGGHCCGTVHQYSINYITDFRFVPPFVFTHYGFICCIKFYKRVISLGGCLPV